MKKGLTALLGLVLLAGCAPVKQPSYLDPQFAARNVRNVALTPVVFADEPLDRYFGRLAAEEIRRQAAAELGRKGYRVDLPADSGPWSAGPPIVTGDADPLRLAPALPPGSDAVMLIRVDHFLDAGLYDERARIPLDVYATATMVADGKILWQGEGRGQGAWQGSRLGNDDYFLAAARLAESVFATLPAR